ncbi:non-hydrolyzing UDP-N-acetylglucosamine 2-epimerase [Parapedobacter sp.]
MMTNRNKIKVLAVIGARPQFIKHAPFDFAARGKVDLVTIHTGQHYDANMSQVFFDQLKIGKPDYLLATGGGSHGEQTGRMLQEIEPIVLEEAPDFLLVYGDTNSTLAGSLIASKLHIPVIHVEAGLRSFNKSMPEEINRILTDHISSMLFTSTEQAVENLRNEGIEENVFLTGDIMADAVKLAESVTASEEQIPDFPYYYVTIHRPYNTDNKARISLLLSELNQVDCPVIFPIHPRTKNLCESFNIDLEEFKNITFIEPASYFDNIRFLKKAKHAITDSGGLQKEAYILKTPCITIRSETEWVETLKASWNVLCFDDLSQISTLLNRTLGEHIPTLYGDGTAANEIVNLILEKSRHSN